MIQSIDVENIPSQELGVVLNEQNCIIDLYTRGGYLYCDIEADDVTIITGAICLNNQNIIPYGYRGFNGNLRFVDLDGETDPVYTGFNDRYMLVYSDEF